LSYPNFPIISFNLCEDLSFNTQEIKLPSHLSILESIFHHRRSPNRHTCPIQPPLAAGHYRQDDSAASIFLVPASSCIPIRNDRKTSSFHSIYYLGYVLEPNLLSSLKNSIYFQISVKNLASCCLRMAITIARFISTRHTNIYWKSEEDVYMFCIQSFWISRFQYLSKNRNRQLPPNLSSAEFQQHSSNLIKHIS
jgi:hypothetical protein